MSERNTHPDLDSDFKYGLIDMFLHDKKLNKNPKSAYTEFAIDIFLEWLYEGGHRIVTIYPPEKYREIYGLKLLIHQLEEELP